MKEGRFINRDVENPQLEKETETDLPERWTPEWALALCSAGI